MKTISLGIGSLALIVIVGFWPGAAQAQYVSNEAFCLSVDSSTNTSSMAFLENRCSYAVNVTYCFGLINCETSPGSTTVPARDKKTIYRRHREDPHLRLIAFACHGDADFVDCQQSKEEFFRSRVRN